MYRATSSGIFLPLRLAFFSTDCRSRPATCSTAMYEVPSALPTSSTAATFLCVRNADVRASSRNRCIMLSSRAASGRTVFTTHRRSPRPSFW